jgi:hypothetical protein
MARTSSELSKLQMPIKDKKSTEIADIYKSSTLLLNVCLINKRIFEKKNFCFLGSFFYNC